MLEAGGRLCRETAGLSGWLPPLLALVPAAERAALPRQADGLPPERMLRELAQRQERAQRLSLGTYRVAEAARKGRRVKELKQALQVH